MKLAIFSAFTVALTNLLIGTPSVVADDEVIVQGQLEQVVVVGDLVAPGGDPGVAQLQRFVKVECAFLRRACKLTDEQEKQLGEFDNKWIDKAIKANGNGRNLADNIARWAVGAQNQQPIPIDIVTMSRTIDRNLKKRFNEILSEQQKTEYETEVQLREKFRQDTAIRCMLAILDQRLDLTEEQSRNIRESLAGWNEYREIYWEFYFQNDRMYVPNIPMQLIEKHLELNQRNQLKGFQRVGINRAQFNNGQAVDVIAR